MQVCATRRAEYSVADDANGQLNTFAGDGYDASAGVNRGTVDGIHS
jgi:hypothetical protein